MLRRSIIVALAAVAVGVVHRPCLAATPTNAKSSLVVTATCGSQQVQVSVNGNGAFTPAHVIGSTAVFVPTAFNLTLRFYANRRYDRERDRHSCEAESGEGDSHTTTSPPP